MSTTSKINNQQQQQQQLIVVVSGGGPVGLTFSLHLTMMMGTNVKIIIYEGRWFVDKFGKTRWQDEEQGKTRRDQVVTLQDHVIKQMPTYIQKGLFSKINEQVWPTSKNIPIREVEDRLFDLIQPFVQNGQIELVPQNLDEKCEYLINKNFDILIGADGSNSFVRRYCNIQMISEGVEYACGVAYNIPNQVKQTDEPLHQALNCILTVSQTRYLVNSSTSRRGYLNIRLIDNEYEQLDKHLRHFQSSNESFDLSDFIDFHKCPQKSVWSIIRQGLQFFKIPAKYVFRVVPIKIDVRYAATVVRELRFEINKDEQSTVDPVQKHYRTALAFLVGDAAMNVHFWPGRGMNSGMKAAMALARNILRSCTKNDTIEIKRPVKFLNFLDYEAFMARLRAREQQGRSLRVLINPIDESILASYNLDDKDPCVIKYRTKLIRKLKETRDRLQQNPEWPHQLRLITDEELREASERIEQTVVAQLSLANPWPTREMSGAEVLVEDMFQYDLKNFLPIPTITEIKTICYPTSIITPRLVNLWIIGNKKNDSIEDLIQNTRNSMNFLETLSNKDHTHQLIVVKTIEEAERWIKSNKELIEKPDVRFKVVTLSITEEKQTPINVIRAVRSEIPQTPVHIFTNATEHIQAACEFPNVTANDNEFDLKEFVGVYEETQWNPGCQIISKNKEFCKFGTFKKLSCQGHPCAQCGKCRDWYYTGNVEDWPWIQNWENWKDEDWIYWNNNRVARRFKKRYGATCDHNRRLDHEYDYYDTIYDCYQNDFDYDYGYYHYIYQGCLCDDHIRNNF